MVLNIDISSLPRAHIIELLKATDKLVDRVEPKKYSSYEPHDKGPDGGQLAFHKAASTHVVRVMATGNRFGKSTCSVKEMEWLATGTHPYRKMPIPNRGKMYGESFGWLNQVFLPKIKELIDPKLLNQKKPFVFNNAGGLQQINWSCGSITVIGTYDQQEKKSEGANYDYVGFDEPPTKNLWIANFRGLIDTGGIAWIAATPLSEPWIYDDLWEPGLNGNKPYVKCIRGSTTDNPNLPKSYINFFISELGDNKDLIAVRLNGEFTTLSGLVINSYSPRLSDIEPFDLDDGFVIYEGIDPHSSKPDAVLWKAIDRDSRRYVVAELSHTGTLSSLVDEIVIKRQQLERYGARVVKSVIDSAINQKAWGTRRNIYNDLRKEFSNKKAGIIPQMAIKGPGSLDDTIKTLKNLYEPQHSKAIDWHSVREYIAKDPYSAEVRGISEIAKNFEIVSDIKQPLQYVFTSCHRYKYELLHYRWPKKTSEIKKTESTSGDIKPIDEFNEYISCDRYIEQLNPRWTLPGDKFVRTLGR